MLDDYGNPLPDFPAATTTDTPPTGYTAPDLAPVSSPVPAGTGAEMQAGSNAANVGSGVQAGGVSTTIDWNNLLPTIKSFLSTPAGAATGIAGLMSLFGGNTPRTAGYHGSIPKYTASRQVLQQPSTPGAYGAARMGKRYFSPTTYAAEGGIMHGSKPQYLSGPTDGMADKLPTSIDGVHPAALSHGEFVIPADVVSHLGNGNSDAGANVLYNMMDKIRKARTGNPKQGKRIDPNKFVPGGDVGDAQYAGGGVIAFTPGGNVPDATTPAVTVGTPGGANSVLSTNTPVTNESNLSEWVGPYVTDMLGKGQALSNTDYTPYTGPLTAGSSPLQDKAFDAAGTLSTPDVIGKSADTASGIASNLGGMKYDPTQFNNGLGPVGSVQSYMNPYMSGVTDFQMNEARRQSDIGRVNDASRLTQAGAYGGSRQAIMDSERERNLNTQLGGIYATGINTAYDKANQQRLAESGLSLQQQQDQEGANQFGANFGLNTANAGVNAANTAAGIGALENSTNNANLNTVANLGATQRGIESEGVAADKAQFDQEQQYPYKQLQFQQSLLNGLPVGTNTTSVGQTPLSQAGSIGTGLQGLYDVLKGLKIGG
jgi:hypothetical protein